MLQLSDLYSDIDRQCIKLFIHDIGFTDAATLEFNGNYAIFFDYSWFKTIKDFYSTLAHEIGHCYTGCTHKASSPLDLISKHEYKANRWAVEKYLPFHELNAAMLNGYTETWQLAEYFNVTEDFVKWATDYYTGPCEMKFGATK